MTRYFHQQKTNNKKKNIAALIYLINLYPLNFIHARYYLFSFAMHLKNETKTTISNIVFPSIMNMKLYSGIKIFINI